MPLDEYRRKRHFNRTPEPKGKKTLSKRTRPAELRFVVQKHAASHLHYDFRLELDGTLKSWAVPKGPCLDPAEKRLAMHVEDHPLEYTDFEGIIPEGEYGGGTVIVWDQGTWIPLGDAAKSYAMGALKFELHGTKLRGRWMLVRTKPKPGERSNPWLLFKERDAEARPLREFDVLAASPESALSGRTLEEVAAAPERTWHSNRPATGKKRIGARPAKVARPSKARFAGELESVKGAVKAEYLQIATPKRPIFAKESPGEDDGWLHEVKFDGYRLLIHRFADDVVIRTRNGIDWTRRFPEIVVAARKLPCTMAVLDGEGIATLPTGVSTFLGLQEALSTGRTAGLIFQAFDLLYLDGFDLRGAILEDRKRILKQLLEAGGQSRLQYTDHFIGDGAEFFRQCCAMQIEGSVSKRRDRPYAPEKKGDWLKFKCVDREEFVIGGYDDSTESAAALDSLHVGYFQDGSLVYAGCVGTGFTHKMQEDLKRRLKPLETSIKPFVAVPKREISKLTRWVSPSLVAHVTFQGWLGDLIRHGSFLGLNEDQPVREVTRGSLDSLGKARATSPQASKVEKARAVSTRPPSLTTADLEAVKGVKFTNPDRVLYPEIGLTKIQLAGFYGEIAPWILPHISDRPLSLVRCPEGHTGQCFFQKHEAVGTPKVLQRIPIPDESGKVEQCLALNNLAGLIALVQQGVLEIHPWGSRNDDVERPDRITIDLDPDPAVAWLRVIAAAREVRDRLQRIGLESFVKTTGGKGLHVVIPIQRRHTWDQVKQFSQALVERMAGDSPQQYTTSASKAARPGRIYLDYLRNGRGATAVAAYSTRARPEAPVSTPLAWDELTPQIRADHFTVGNLRARLASLRNDPWAELEKIKQFLKMSDRRRLLQ